MEKPTAHYKLATVKTLIQANKVTATQSATLGAQAAGVTSLQSMCDVVLGLTASNFYKSMTSHTNHRVWQDVYHCVTQAGVRLYIKLTVMDGVLIISFKEL